jgi:hypothetical protein
MFADAADGDRVLEADGAKLDTGLKNPARSLARRGVAKTQEPRPK